MPEICQKCDGTGKIEEPINMQEMGEIPCDLCGGTGYLPEADDISRKLDRIIELLEYKFGLRESVSAPDEEEKP